MKTNQQKQIYETKTTTATTTTTKKHLHKTKKTPTKQN